VAATDPEWGSVTRSPSVPKSERERPKKGTKIPPM
jgi:hypothetical protein